MSFGTRIAQSAEQDRQRALRQAQAQEEEQEQSPQQTQQAPAPASAPVRSASRPANSRPGGGFRPGGFNRPLSRDRDEARVSGPNVSLAVEDGVGTVQVIRRLLEVSAVRKWPHNRVSRLEALAHEDPDAAWSEVSSHWEQLCEERRKAVSDRDSGQISFRIVSDGVAKESNPTGPRASSMALLHGLDMVRLSVDRSPFSPETVARVAQLQRELRQKAISQPSPSQQGETPQPPTQSSPQDDNSSSSPPSGGRFVRNMR